MDRDRGAEVRGNKKRDFFPGGVFWSEVPSSRGRLRAVDVEGDKFKSDGGDDAGVDEILPYVRFAFENMPKYTLDEIYQ